MSTAVKVGLGFVVGALLGGGGGFYGGFSLGATAIVRNWAGSETQNTDDMVTALEFLRAKKDKEASAALEAHLDKHVFGIMPDMRGEITLLEPALKKIQGVKKRVQAYRKANPRPETKFLNAKDVDAYLATD